MVMWKRGCEFCHQDAEPLPERAHEQIHKLMEAAQELHQISRFAESRWRDIDAGLYEHDAEGSFLELRDMLTEAASR